MIPQPGTSGDWTVYMTGDETPRIDEVNSAQICITRCTNQGFYNNSDSMSLTLSLQISAKI